MNEVLKCVIQMIVQWQTVVKTKRSQRGWCWVNVVTDFICWTKHLQLICKCQQALSCDTQQFSCDAKKLPLLRQCKQCWSSVGAHVHYSRSFRTWLTGSWRCSRVSHNMLVVWHPTVPESRVPVLLMSTRAFCIDEWWIPSTFCLPTEIAEFESE